MSEQNLEEMSSFFDKRANTYDDYMLKELGKRDGLFCCFPLWKP